MEAYESTELGATDSRPTSTASSTDRNAPSVASRASAARASVTCASVAGRASMGETLDAPTGMGLVAESVEVCLTAMEQTLESTVPTVEGTLSSTPVADADLSSKVVAALVRPASATAGTSWWTLAKPLVGVLPPA